MKSARLHKKVWLAWGRWWAIQFVGTWYEFSFPGGIWIELKRPLLDLHFMWFTISIGNHPVRTDPRHRYRHGGRGFVVLGTPDEAVL